MEKRKVASIILTVLIGLSIFVTTIGVSWKIMHWPYAGHLVIIGFLSIAVFSALHFFIKKKKSWAGFFKTLAALFFCIRAIFILNHWPYVLLWHILFLVTLSIWLFLMFRIKKRSKKSIDHVKNGLLIIALLSFSYGLLALWQHWLHGFFGLMIAFVFMVSWIVLHVVFPNGPTIKNKSELFRNILIAIAAVGILVGGLFTVMHWTFGKQFLVLGFIAGIIWSFLVLFPSSNENKR